MDRAGGLCRSSSAPVLLRVWIHTLLRPPAHDAFGCSLLQRVPVCMVRALHFP